MRLEQGLDHLGPAEAQVELVKRLLTPTLSRKRNEGLSGARSDVIKSRFHRHPHTCREIHAFLARFRQ